MTPDPDEKAELFIGQAIAGGWYVKHAGDLVVCVSNVSELCAWLESKLGPLDKMENAPPEEMPRVLKSTEAPRRTWRLFAGGKQ